MGQILQGLPTDNLPFMLAVGVIAVLLLVFLFKMVAWVFSGLLNVGFLLAGLALAAASFFGLKSGNQQLLLGGFGGLIILAILALALRKRPS